MPDTIHREYIGQMLFLDIAPLAIAGAMRPVERMPLPLPRDFALRLATSADGARQMIFTWKWDAGHPSEELCLAPETSAVEAFVTIANALERTRPWAHGGALLPRSDK